MAITKHEITKITGRNEAAILGEDITVGDGVALDFTGDDNKIFLLAMAEEITVKAGNSMFAGEDLTISAGNVAVIDSGRFKNVSGEFKDHVIVTGVTGSEMLAIELP